MQLQALTIIPARGGSKGIPMKNMASICGRPLIEYTFSAALQANIPGRICLSTDHQDIYQFGLSHGIEAPFIRPSEFAQDNSSSLSVVHHALQWYRVQENFYPEYIILLQPTCPFRTAENIVESFEIISQMGADSLLSVNLVTEHPCEYIVRNNSGFSYVMPPPEKPGRQNFPEVHFINGAIYITRTSFWDQTGLLYDQDALTYVMSRTQSLDIDDPEDLAYANWLYQNLQRKES